MGLVLVGVGITVLAFLLYKLFEWWKQEYITGWGSYFTMDTMAWERDGYKLDGAIYKAGKWTRWVQLWVYKEGKIVVSESKVILTKGRSRERVLDKVEVIIEKALAKAKKEDAQ